MWFSLNITIMKKILLLLFIITFMSCNDQNVGNYRELKGSVVVSIRKRAFRNALTPYDLCVRTPEGVLKSFKITTYENNTIQLGDTIK